MSHKQSTYHIGFDEPAASSSPSAAALTAASLKAAALGAGTTADATSASTLTRASALASDDRTEVSQELESTAAASLSAVSTTTEDDAALSGALITAGAAEGCVLAASRCMIARSSDTNCNNMARTAGTMQRVAAP